MTKSAFATANGGILERFCQNRKQFREK